MSDPIPGGFGHLVYSEDLKTATEALDEHFRQMPSDSYLAEAWRICRADKIRDKVKDDLASKDAEIDDLQDTIERIKSILRYH